jgi:hypothetical protein
MGLFREKLKIKVCSGCGRAKVVGDYYKNRSNEDGLDHYCKRCRSEFSAEWAARRKDRRYLIQWRYRNKQLKINE